MHPDPQHIGEQVAEVSVQKCAAFLHPGFPPDETSRNLELKALARLLAVETLQPLLQQVPEPPPELPDQAQAAGLPSKDAPILAAVAACCADWLATGDRRDFGHLCGQRALGMLLPAPREALAALLDTLE